MYTSFFNIQTTVIQPEWLQKEKLSKESSYLNDVTEHKDVKPGQVLDMVLLNHFDVSSDQSPDLLQQEEELCNGPVEMRTRRDTDIARP